jgi:hypothetical protein
MTQPTEAAGWGKVEGDRILRAIYLAQDAHRGQLDKGGESKLWHVLRVGMKLLPDIDAAVLGILHDVIEDTDATNEDILNAFGDGYEYLFPLLGTLTHDGKQPYLEYVRDCAAHPITRKVKLADMRDNTDPWRMEKLAPPERFRLLDKYTLALIILTEVDKPVEKTPDAPIK